MGLRLIGNATIDDRDSAFPQATELDDGQLICSYSNAGGMFATGGTDIARSTDGLQWEHSGTLLEASTDPASSNYLKVSRSTSDPTLWAYGARAPDVDAQAFGARPADAVFCRSTDGGRSWTSPVVIPTPTKMLEISHGILCLSGRLIAPAATIEEGQLGAQVIGMMSDDGGETWPEVATIMVDPQGRVGYLEQKLCVLPSGMLVATAWTVTLDGLIDQQNSFTTSTDNGSTWTTPRPMGIMGQTLSLTPISGDQVLITYNRRTGDPGVVANLARFDGDQWQLGDELLVHDPNHIVPDDERRAGVDDMLDHQFGFPTGVLRRDGTVVVTYWSIENQRCGVRSAVLALD